MGQMNVEQFAAELGVPGAQLLEQLRAAGVDKLKLSDVVSEQDKTRLLEYLRRAHGTGEGQNKITLTRRQTSEIRKADSSGKSRTIQVEVRKKRVFVKREETPVQEEAPVKVEAPEPVPVPAPVAEAAAPRVLDEEQLLLRQEEAAKNAELAARQAAEFREKEERRLQKREQAEAKPVEEVKVEGTLHKPAATEEKGEKKGAKKAAKPVWKDEGVKKGGLKVRGDLGTSQGWRGGKKEHKNHRK